MKTPGSDSDAAAEAGEEDGSDTEEESEVDVEALEEDELWVQEGLFRNKCFFASTLNDEIA